MANPRHYLTQLRRLDLFCPLRRASAIHRRQSSCYVSSRHGNHKRRTLPGTFHSVHFSTQSPILSDGNVFSLYDSLSGQKQILPTPPHHDDDPNNSETKNLGLAWYTCGPTTYAPAHLGHARTYVCLDIIRRVLEAHSKFDLGRPPPVFVMNITDVDDKILAAAVDQNMDPIDLARKYEADFWKDLDALNCLRPHIVTRVTEHVESHIVPFVHRLVQLGMAYELSDGIYFHVQAYNEKLGTVTKYGKLAPPGAVEPVEITSCRPPTEARITEKIDSRDFVLWKRKKPMETMAWPSPWGEGRPGWHIECSAMIESVQSQFQDTHRFMVHAGGVDLKFPHHTNEIAQSEAYRETGDWIPHWVHTGHLHIDGLKMSKSLKNFVSIQEFLLAERAHANTDGQSALESPGDDFRLWCLGLSGSYRGPATFCTKRLEEARVVRQQILRFLLDGQSWVEERTLESTTTKLWEKEDVDLYATCQESRRFGMLALRNDLDGTEYLKKCLHIVSVGSVYLSKRGKQTSSPLEPMKMALSTLRDMLELVGVSEKTTRVGLDGQQGDRSSSISQVAGGEEILADVLVKFRSSVRREALRDVKSGRGTENTLSILETTDRLRDLDLPRIGIEVLDEKSENEQDTWRFCVPRDVGQTNDDSLVPPKVESKIDLMSIPLEDLFRVGRYEGAFSQYDAEGIPTHNADGTEVSGRALKKLLKKRDEHLTRLSRKVD